MLVVYCKTVGQNSSGWH